MSDSEPVTPPPVRRSMTTPPPLRRIVHPMSDVPLITPMRSRRRLFAETDDNPDFQLEIPQYTVLVFRRQHRHRQIGQKNNNQ